MNTKFVNFLSDLFGKGRLFKFVFNILPMYRNTTARVLEASPDLRHVRIKLAMSYRNRNYVGTMFGGVMFSAVDPFPMVQLINIIGPKYVVWDKKAEIYFKAPAKEDLYAEFEYSENELIDIKEKVRESGRTEIVKITKLTDKSGKRIYCEVHKTLYISDAELFKKKKRERAEAESE